MVKPHKNYIRVLFAYIVVFSLIYFPVMSWITSSIDESSMFKLIVSSTVWLVVVGWISFYELRFKDIHSYTLRDNDISIVTGAIGRKTVTVPYDRITDVQVIQKPLDRINGITSIYINTAGSTLPEGIIIGLSQNEAEKLKETILKKKA